ncbi:hypothetical protein ABQ179_022625 [Xanthomonas dyei]|uniref:hypothetical protein n=1 Tax=Xanthomonas dyei TaxID=743699 RepID=UPI0032E913FC
MKKPQMELEFKSSLKYEYSPNTLWKERILAVLFVLFIHLIIYFLLKKEIAVREPLPATDSALTLFFLPRTDPKFPQLHLKPNLNLQNSAVKLSIQPPAPLIRRRTEAASSSNMTASENSVDHREEVVNHELDLSLPEEYKNTSQVQPNVLPATSEPSTSQNTRFEKNWAPDGQEMQQTWAFRSKAAALLLSATGALRRPCTDLERKRRDKKCFGSQYEGDDVIRDSQR